MCMVDDGEGWKVYREEIRTTRKERKCGECYRPIAIGERYQYAAGLGYDWDRWESFVTCEHCAAGPCSWLIGECSGYLFHGVYDDLTEHWNEEPDYRQPSLGRLIVGMRRKWRRRDGSLMAVPA